jgi:hypothetical protein
VDSAFALFLLFPLAVGLLAGAFFRRQKRRGRAGWVSLVVGNLLIFLVLAGLLFDGFEVYYRFIYDTTDSVAVTKSSQAWFRRYYIKNSAGFRDNIEYSTKIQPGRRRVTFVGDSFLAGHGVKSVGNRFANRIRANHPEWEIQVLAQIGYDTDDEIQMMQKSLAAGEQLDEVVLVYNLNDIADLDSEWGKVLLQLGEATKHRARLIDHSYFLDLMYYRLVVARNPNIKNYYGFVRSAYNGPLWEAQKQQLNEFRTLVESHGGRFSVVVFPFLHQTGTNYQYGAVHEQLDRFWRESNVPCLDLLPVFKDLPPEKITVNKFDAHPNEYAHQLAAEKIDPFLAKLMMLEH